MINKSTGSYYTPTILSDFLAKHLQKYFVDNKSMKILEPSCGDGTFIKSISENFQKKEKNTLDICDINTLELDKTYAIATKSNIFDIINSYDSDYLLKPEKKYNLIIGNPPYISKKTLSNFQIQLCKKIILSQIPNYGEVKNIWPAFLVKATGELSENGILCYVLPSEILQVKYTSLIREYLLKNYNKIEIFAFNELLFKGAEQDVIVFIGQKKSNSINNEVSFYQVEKLIDLKIPDFIKKNANINRKKLSKWTNYILTEFELDLIERMSTLMDLKPIMNYCSKAEVGIVTAANDFFIRKRSETKCLNLMNNKKFILKKSSFIKSLDFNIKERKNLINSDKPIDLIYLKGRETEKHNNTVKKFIKLGENKKIHLRYKMKKRNYWYDIPSVWFSDALFVKRCHLHPKIILNSAKSLCTDSFYRINMKNKADCKRFIFSFNNTLTYILAELEGRYYGGGVLELTPSEFKSLQIPSITNIKDEDFDKLNQMFLEKRNIIEVLDFTDKICFPDLSIDQINTLRSIWKKLVCRRTKDNKVFDKFT